MGLDRLHQGRDHKRSQLMARIVALIFNWWSIFTRMATRNVRWEV
jgi:hypothetical protein